MTVATNRQNTSIVLVEVIAVVVAVFASSTMAVTGSDQMAFANKHEGNKDGQKISQSDGNRSIRYIIICQTRGTNSPITDHSCNNQLTSTKTNSGVSTGYLTMKKNYGQKISENDDGSIRYIIICQTRGTNSPITDHSCNNQLTDGNEVPLIIPLVFG
jgi:hypothetical protein